MQLFFSAFSYTGSNPFSFHKCLHQCYNTYDKSLYFNWLFNPIYICLEILVIYWSFIIFLLQVSTMISVLPPTTATTCGNNGGGPPEKRRDGCCAGGPIFIVDDKDNCMCDCCEAKRFMARDAVSPCPCLHCKFNYFSFNNNCDCFCCGCRWMAEAFSFCECNCCKNIDWYTSHLN